MMLEKYSGVKELVIHAGYPKTATKTIQTAWLYPAHKKEMINFLGMYSWGSTDIDEDSIHFDREFAGNRSKLKNKLDFSDEKINVISDEGLLEPLLYKKRRHKLYQRFDYRGEEEYSEEYEIDPFDYPEMLKSYFEEFVDKITIWITIRNQQSLINSMYAQYHEYFTSDKKRNTWEKYLNTILTEKENIFHFYKLINSYSESFGKDNIKIMLFEEFINKRQRYIQEIAQTLKIDYNKFDEIIDMDAHKNKKKGDSSKRIIKDISSYGKHIDYLLSKFNIAGVIKPNMKYILGETRYDQLINHLFENKFEIEKPTEKQKAKIYEKYKCSNHKLCSNTYVDEEKLKQYNYI